MIDLKNYHGAMNHYGHPYQQGYPSGGVPFPPHEQLPHIPPQQQYPSVEGPYPPHEQLPHIPPQQPHYVNPYSNPSNEVSQEVVIPMGGNEQQLIAQYVVLFENPIVRRKFIGQVLTTVGIMLAFVALIISLSYIPYIRQNLTDKDNIVTVVFVVLGVFIVWLVLVIALLTSKCLRKTYPFNIIGLALYALCMGVFAILCTAVVDPLIVLKAGIETFVIVIVIGLVARFTTIDATGYGFLWKFSIFALFISSVSFGITMVIGHVTLVSNIVSSIMVLLYMVFIFIDLQLIMGGKRNAISPDEPVYGAILLFTDIMMLFMYILSLSAKSNS